jgi:glycogen synthase
VRILLLPSAFAPAIGGVEELTRRLADRLVEAGDAVEVWTHRHPLTLAEQEVVDGHKVRRFDMAMPSLRKDAGLGFARSAPGVLRSMVLAAKEFRPDVIHVQCFSNNGAYATALGAMLKRPVVVTLQGETVMDDNDIYARSAVQRAALRLGLRRAAAVTGCSAFTLQDAERFGLQPGRGEVVFNGVDLDGRQQPTPVAVPFPRFVFAVGRFVENKGFDLLLDAFEVLAERVSDVGLLIGGDGRARPPMIERLRRSVVGERVLLPGRMTGPEVMWAMRHAAVFVLPSRVEPFGIVVIEALREGCPAVVSSVGGAPEIVRGERGGLIADPRDRTALSSAIELVLTNAEMRRHLSVAGRERAKDFDWSKISQQYREIYAAVA